LLRRRWRRPHGLTVFAWSLVVYFGYHMVDGSRGLPAWWQVRAELEASRTEYARLKLERAALERKVVHLRRSSLDPDLLDEQARGMLSLAGPDDVIILLDPADGKTAPR
jgi:cell division protein FtsB